jgi:N-methylhydantoinase A
MNAYVQPVVDRYLGLLESRLAGLGFSGRFHVMTSSGGMLTPDVARRFPIRLLESGPAAGVLMAAYHGRTEAVGNVLSFDMGGTTAKGALVRKGRPLKRYQLEVARVHEFKPGSGLPAEAPVIDMIEIGAGGGSIAAIDERGVIRVGPESSGADPGPACYGQGGNLPTLTDANLVLGYLDAGSFLGGRMALDVSRARQVIEIGIAAPLGLDLLRAAWGIHETINETVARAFRVHASERGFDYRTASLVGFGGSGPVHACRIARKLGIPRVLLPPGAGVMSALGLLQSPYAFELARTVRVRLDALSAERYREGFGSIEAEVLEVLAETGLPRDSVRLSRRLDIRFEGQGYEIETEAGETPDGLAERFLAAYRAVFATAPDGEPLEAVNWKIEGSGPPPLGGLEFHFDFGPGGQSGSLKGMRPVYYPDTGLARTPIHDRYLMQPGDEVIGPAIVEERESTLVLGPGDRARLDGRLNLVVTLGGGDGR